jgi:small subunit ribosomal protein S20
MSNIKSAAKRARQSVRRHARNSSEISHLKSTQKKLRAAISAGKTDEAKVQYKEVASALDKAAKRGVIHKNAADRKKSRLSRALQPAKPAAA